MNDKMQTTIEMFDALFEMTPKVERKGKTVPYSSSNGYMFALVNKDGEFGLRYAKDVQEKYIESFGSDYLKSHGATMKGYVLIPESMYGDLEELSKYLLESYEYVNSLPPK